MQTSSSRSSLAAALGAVALMLGLGAEAHPQRGADRSNEVGLFQSDANAVKRITAFRVDRFVPVDDRHLVIWTRPNAAYLVTLRHPLIELRHARAIGMTSTAASIHRDFDYVVVNGMRHRMVGLHALDRDEARALTGRS